MLDQVADAPVEALHHAIGLGMAWWRQAVFDAHLGTADIERVLACGTFVPGRETIRELTAVVSENLLNHRCDLFQPAQKIGAADFSLVFVGLLEIEWVI